MGPVLKILLRFEERFWPQRLSTLACGVGPVTLYWAASHSDGNAMPVLVAYCTGPRAAALSRLSETEAAHIALQDLRRNFPGRSAKLAAFRRIDWDADPFSCGGYTFLRPGGSGARERLLAPDTGALLWAGSATATTAIAATVNAAFVSGLQSANKTLALLCQG
jgi:monoamine oxidase